MSKRVSKANNIKYALSGNDPLAQWNADDDAKIISITAPVDLQQRLRQLPREVQADGHRYVLCASPERMAHAIEEASP